MSHDNHPDVPVFESDETWPTLVYALDAVGIVVIEGNWQGRVGQL